MKVIFQGLKFYWRTRNAIDVTIVDHFQQNLTEVILYEPTLGKESTRICLRTTVLLSKLNHDDIALQLSFAKRNGAAMADRIRDGVLNKAKSDFILNRLVITEYDLELKKVLVSFQLESIDVEAKDLLCGYPMDFVPFKTIHRRAAMARVVDLAINALDVDKKTGRLKRPKSNLQPLSTRERWRIPLVFIHVLQGQRLNLYDAKIWSSVTQNMRTEEDAARLAAVLDGYAGLKLCTPSVEIVSATSVSGRLVSSMHPHVLVRVSSESGYSTPPTAPTSTNSSTIVHEQVIAVKPFAQPPVKPAVQPAVQPLLQPAVLPTVPRTPAVSFESNDRMLTGAHITSGLTMAITLTEAEILMERLIQEAADGAALVRITNHVPNVPRRKSHVKIDYKRGETPQTQKKRVGFQELAGGAAGANAQPAPRSLFNILLSKIGLDSDSGGADKQRGDAPMIPPPTFFTGLVKGLSVNKIYADSGEHSPEFPWREEL